MAIVTAAVLSRYFEKAEYGTYKQIVYVYTTLSVIFSAGLPRVFSYYLPQYSLAEGKDITWKIMKLLFGLGFIFSSILFFTSGLIADVLRNNELKYGLKLFAPVPFLLFPTLGIEGILNSYKKAQYIALYQVISRTLMLFLIVLPIIFIQNDYRFAIYGWISSSVINLLLASYFKGIPFRRVPREASNIEFAAVFKYSLPILFASIWGLVMNSSNQFFISRYFGEEKFAEYANGFIQLPLVSIVTGSISAVLMPVFSKKIYEKKIESVKKTLQNVIKKSALLIYPLVVFFMVFARDVIIILYTDSYSNSIIYFRLAMVLNFFNIIVFTPVIFASGNTKYYSKIHMYAAILIWCLQFLVVKIYDSPILVVVIYVIVNIFLILNAFNFISRILEVRVVDLLPLKKISIILLHSLIITFLTYIVFLYIDLEVSIVFEIIAKFLIFSIILLTTGFIVKLNYLEIFLIKSQNIKISNGIS